MVSVTPAAVIISLDDTHTDVTDDGATKDGVLAHVPQLRVFRDVAGYCGVSVCLYVHVCNYVWWMYLLYNLLF